MQKDEGWQPDKELPPMARLHYAKLGIEFTVWGFKSVPRTLRYKCRKVTFLARRLEVEIKGSRTKAVASL